MNSRIKWWSSPALAAAWVDVELAEAGPHQLQFSVDGGAGESELRNNTRSTLVNVANEEYRILYFEGEPRWEYKFMRRAISGLPAPIDWATMEAIMLNRPRHRK